MWVAKLAACAFYDVVDFTVGRVLFPVPFLGEAVGMGLCCLMFGKQGLLYGLEGIDLTEQIDGFVPTATIVAIRNRPSRTRELVQTVD